jgi:type I restriction enzyme S subunit
MVPKLRFYIEKSIFEKTCLQKITDGIGDGIHATPTYLINGDCFFINGNNLKNGSIILTESTKKISYQEKSKYRDNLNDRSILLSINGTIGNLAYYNNEPILLGKSAAYINVSPLYCKRWVYYILQSNSILRYFEQELTGTTIKNLSLKTIRDAVVYSPSLEEQTKVSSFLSSVDEKITLLNKQYELLCLYKKGMMQKIFSLEVRFKAERGEKFSDWNEILLGKVGEIITGKTPSTSVTEYWNGDILFTTPTDMNDSIKYLTATERKVTLKGIKRVLPKGTIMFTCIASIGKMALSTLPCITNQQINSIIVNEKYNNEFIYYYLQYIKPKIIATQANTTVPIVNKSDFSAISLQMPNLAEQTKIANFLSAMDDKITTQKVELDMLKTWKQGLLQQMFV